LGPWNILTLAEAKLNNSLLVSSNRHSKIGGLRTKFRASRGRKCLALEIGDSVWRRPLAAMEPHDQLDNSTKSGTVKRVAADEIWRNFNRPRLSRLFLT